MATVTKINPIVNTAAIEYYGSKPLTIFEVDFGAAVNAKTGAESTISAVINKINEHCTIVLRSELHSTNQVMTFFVEHTNLAVTYDGSNSETFVVFLATEIVALGTVDGINLASSSLAVKTTLNIA